MITSKQLQYGNRDEKLVIQVFRNKGYWAHNFAKSSSGSQPVDVIAIKENTCWLVDVKNVENGISFPISRVEPNQWACMDYARNFAKIQNLGVVICFEREQLDPLLLEYDKLLELKNNGEKSIKMNELKRLEEYL